MLHVYFPCEGLSDVLNWQAHWFAPMLTRFWGCPALSCKSLFRAFSLPPSSSSAKLLRNKWQLIFSSFHLTSIVSRLFMASSELPMFSLSTTRLIDFRICEASPNDFSLPWWGVKGFLDAQQFCNPKLTLLIAKLAMVWRFNRQTQIINWEKLSQLHPRRKTGAKFAFNSTKSTLDFFGFIVLEVLFFRLPTTPFRHKLRARSTRRTLKEQKKLCRSGTSVFN